MIVYPFSTPIILTRDLFVRYGGNASTFSDEPLNDSFWMAEMQVTAYIGTPLLPITLTGTMNYLGSNRLITQYGYVHNIYSVNVLSKQAGIDCTLHSDSGCAFIYEDTYGYVDFRKVYSACGCGSIGDSYQVQIAYQAGLPTGTANQPGILRALTILAQIDLDDKFPGTAGLNEGSGDVTISEFRSLDYFEKRSEHALIQTALGGSPKAMRAKRLIDASIRKARPALFA